MDTTDTTPAQCLDGPGLAAWIDKEEGGEIKKAESRLGIHARKVRAWREGQQASVETADVVLLKLGLHLTWVPEHLFVPLASRREKPPEVKAEIVRRACELKEPTKVVACALGCSPSTVLRTVRAHAVLQTAA